MSQGYACYPHLRRARRACIYIYIYTYIHIYICWATFGDLFKGPDQFYISIKQGSIATGRPGTFLNSFGGSHMRIHTYKLVDIHGLLIPHISKFYGKHFAFKKQTHMYDLVSACWPKPIHAHEHEHDVDHGKCGVHALRARSERSRPNRVYFFACVRTRTCMACSSNLLSTDKSND
jgi:hypothetical protein